MVVCEVCGTKTHSARKVSLDGAILTVCEKCSSMGTDLGGYGTVRTRRPRYRREETEMGLVDGYEKAIQRERTARNWKQEELARKINEPESLVNKIESGKITPSEKVSRKLEKILGVSILERVERTAVEFDRSKGKAVTLGDVVTIRKRK